jgi:hypothetical protein
MKYVCMAAGALMTLIPALAQAQNSQFTKCHSLETSGNFIGPDEALVNGMVCKVAKGKSNSSSSDAADAPKKPTEGSLALLGLIEPDILRAKEKAKAKQAAAAPDAPTAEANPEAKPNGSAATNPAEAPAFGTVFQGSLGAIARGYRNNGAGQATAPEAVIVDGKKTGLEFEAAKAPSGTPSATAPAAAATLENKPTAEAVVSALPVSPKEMGQEVMPPAPAATARLATVQPAVATPMPAPISAPALETKSEIVSTPPAQAVEAKTPASSAVAAPSVAAVEQVKRESQENSAAPVAAPSNPPAPVEAAPASAAKSEVAATAPAPAVKSEVANTPATQPIEAKPEAAPASAAPAEIETEPARVEASLQAPVAPPVNATELQPAVQSGQAGASVAAQKPLAVETKPEIIPVASATEKAPELEPERTAKADASGTPERGPDADAAQPPLEADADLTPFREGQEAACRKNISLGSMEREKLFLAIPDWALEWYGKNQKRFPGICFSNAPMPGAKNFLVVFDTGVEGVAESVRKSFATGGSNPTIDKGEFKTGYGDTWHFTFQQTVTTTITSVSAEEAPHNQQKPLLFATAYTASGIPVSQHHRNGPTSAENVPKETSKKAGKDHKEPLSPAFRAMTELLGEIVEDIAKH